jgi:hypothetical protein
MKSSACLLSRGPVCRSKATNKISFFRNETSIYSQWHRQPLLSLAKLRAALVGRHAAAIAQTAAPSDAPATLNAVGFNLVSQVNLGALLQVDSGRLAETKGTSAAIRNYAHLMVTSHIPVVERAECDPQDEGHHSVELSFARRL